MSSREWSTRDVQTRPPTAFETARYSHVTAVIRAALKEKQLSAVEFRKQLGLSRDSTVIYTWINGYSAPKEFLRDKVAEVLGIPAEKLIPADVVKGSINYKTAEQPQRSHRPSTTIAVIPPQQVGGDGLQMSLVPIGEGMMRLKMDVILNINDATSLMALAVQAMGDKT